MIGILTETWLWAEHLTKKLFGFLTLKNLLKVWVVLFALGLVGLVIPITVLVWTVTGHIEWIAIRSGMGIAFFLSATLIMGPALRLLGVKNARLAWLAIGVLIAVLLILSKAANDYLVAPFGRIAILGLVVLLLLVLSGRRMAMFGLWIIPWVLIIIGIFGGIYMNPDVRKEAREIKLPKWSTSAKKEQRTTLPQKWNELVTLKPTESLVLDLPSLTCGSRYDERLIDFQDPVGGGCVEVWADGKRYMNCPGTFVDIPRKAKDWVFRNTTKDTLTFPLSVTSVNHC